MKIQTANIIDPKECGLIAPKQPGDGSISATQRELTTAEEIRKQIDAPVRNARAGALKDAVLYLTDNAINDTSLNVRQAINIRWNLPWTEVDAIIRQAQPLAKHEIEKAKVERIRIEQERIRFESLVDL